MESNEREELEVLLAKHPELASLLEEKEKTISTLKQEVQHLQWKVAEYQHALFGKQSEKRKYLPQGFGPFLPFPGFETQAQEQAPPSEKIQVAPHQRKKHGRRKEFPAHLPRVVDRYDLSEGAKVCDCGGELHPIGVERSQAIERLELCYVQVDEFVKYACRCCERIHVADRLARVLDRCILGPSALAQIIYDRFGNHLPLPA